MRGKWRVMRSAFTMIEVIVMIVILGILAVVIAPRVLQHVGKSKQSVAASGVASLSMSLQSYAVANGMPESGASLRILWEKPAANASKWDGPYVNSEDDLVDPWGHPYVLLIPSQHGNADFDIISYGADGQPGGEGENEDIVSGKKR